MLDVYNEMNPYNQIENLFTSIFRVSDRNYITLRKDLIKTLRIRFDIIIEPDEKCVIFDKLPCLNDMPIHFIFLNGENSKKLINKTGMKKYITYIGNFGVEKIYFIPNNFLYINSDESKTAKDIHWNISYLSNIIYDALTAFSHMYNCSVEYNLKISRVMAVKMLTDIGLFDIDDIKTKYTFKNEWKDILEISSEDLFTHNIISVV